MNSTIQSGAESVARLALARDVSAYATPTSREAPSSQAAHPATDLVASAATKAATAAPKPPVVTAEVASQVARQINEFLKLSSAANVEVSVDTDSGAVVMRVVDNETHEVLRQIPSEEMLAISKSIDQMTGLLLRQKAG